MVELVIKIPEKEFGIDINDKFQDFFQRLKVEIKEHLISGTGLVCGAYELETIEMFLNAFADLISLPKEHGRLIDADVFEKRLMNASLYYMGEKADIFDLRFAAGLDSAAERLVSAPTVIEGDKEVKE